MALTTCCRTASPPDTTTNRYNTHDGRKYNKMDMPIPDLKKKITTLLASFTYIIYTMKAAAASMAYVIKKCRIILGDFVTCFERSPLTDPIDSETFAVVDVLVDVDLASRAVQLLTHDLIPADVHFVSITDGLHSLASQSRPRTHSRTAMRHQRSACPCLHSSIRRHRGATGR